MEANLRGGDLRREAERHQVFVPTDNPFQRKARLLQARWRESQNLPIGEHGGRPLGSRIAMPYAQETLRNYLTEGIREVVRQEVVDPFKSRGKLFGKPRIFNDLLSSQPLAFNLFAELKRDLPLASRIFAALTDDRVHQVTAIEFEHSPGRGDMRYTGDRSAFDVYVEYQSKNGKRGFVGIEVKYHEGLGEQPAPHRDRYDEIADLVGCFLAGQREFLMKKPLQQIWRDHLLACSLLSDRDAGFDDGLFVFLYPRENTRCAQAVVRYRECVTDTPTFTAWTLHEVAEAIASETNSSWIDAFRQRYLAFSTIGDEGA